MQAVSHAPTNSRNARPAGNHRRLNNDALAERTHAWAQEQRSGSYGEQSGQVKATRTTHPFLAATNVSRCQATVRRRDKAVQAFFGRVKAGETPGHPRCTGRNRCDTVAFPFYGDGCRVDRRCVSFQHIGCVKVKLQRPLEGQLKTLSFKHEADGWYVMFSCDLGDVAVQPAVHPAIGIDFGLQAFLVTSEGENVAPPHHDRPARAALRQPQRKVARRQKGSKRRAHAVHALPKQHQRIGTLRCDSHHKTARARVTGYGTIVHEDLTIRGIARSRLAKARLDVAWGSFLHILAYNAADLRYLVLSSRTT